MGYLTNSGTGFLKGAVTTVSNVKSYLVNKTGYLVDAIRVGIGDFGQRVLDDGGTVEASAEAAASYREITKDIYDQASLVLFPSGYKDNLLYSHKPVDGSGDFTYTRGTDTATRVGADGYIKKERANLLLQSNQFDTTWIGNASNRSITGGFSGYDGSNDAWKLEAISDNNYSVVNQVVSSTGVQTFSVYAKAGTSNFFRIQITGGTNTSASYFDLSGSGSVGTNFNNIDAKIEAVGNGWFRCSVTGNKTTSTNCVIYVVDANNSTNVTTGANVYIQDAQLEQGLVATSYIETTTAPVYEGFTDNLPRIDYTGGTPSILLEPSRTNVVPYSEHFEYIGWSKTRCTITDNYAISPEGLQNAALMTATAADARLEEALTLSGDYTQSIWVKSGQSGDVDGQIDFAGIAVVTFTANQEWQRVETTANTAHRVRVRITNSGDKLFVYGAQLEEGSYATSYIPTYNASATRAADSFNTLTYADNFNSLTFYAEIEMKDVIRESINGATAIIRFGDTSSNNGAIRIFRNSATNPKRAVVIARNSSGGNIINYSATEDRVKIKLTYDSTSPDGDWELFINGESEATGTSLDFNEFDTLEISGVGGQARIYKMYIKNSI